jgi:hypothetical protein
VAWTAAASGEKSGDVYVAISRDSGATFASPVRVNSVQGDARVSGEIAPLDAKKGIVPEYMKANMGSFFRAGKTFSGEQDGWPNGLVFNSGYAQGIQGLFTGQTSVDSTLKSMDSLWSQSG